MNIKTSEKAIDDRITVISALVVVIVFWGGAVWLAWQFVPTERRVDCSLVEISPDFTPEMRKACREARRVRT